jgi:biopolymer transport protein ExbD
MTPFVCVALVLITFFVWMKQLQRDKIISVYAQTRGKVDYRQPVTASLVLLDSDRIGFWQFRAGGDGDYVETHCAMPELRAILRRVALSVNPVLIIQPTAQSRIKNLVTVVDALQRNRRITYMLVF